jgi:predicted phage-related endonuclease
VAADHLPAAVDWGVVLMTLHTFPELEQGSPEWLDARRGLLTASVIGQLITPSTLKVADNPKSRAIVAELAAERITGFTDDHYASDDMVLGHDVEPHAIKAYEKYTGNPVTTLGFMIREEPVFKLGCSPDGLVDDDGMVECKSRRPKKHLQTVLEGSVPAENVAQCQASLFVSGRDWLDYVSYSGGLELYIVTVTPDQAWFDAIAAAATQFELAVTQMVDTYTTRVKGLPMTERIDFNRVELNLA